MENIPPIKDSEVEATQTHIANLQLGEPLSIYLDSNQFEYRQSVAGELIQGPNTIQFSSTTITRNSEGVALSQESTIIAHSDVGGSVKIIYRSSPEAEMPEITITELNGPEEYAIDVAKIDTQSRENVVSAVATVLAALDNKLNSFPIIDKVKINGETFILNLTDGVIQDSVETTDLDLRSDQHYRTAYINRGSVHTVDAIIRRGLQESGGVLVRGVGKMQREKAVNARKEEKESYERSRYFFKEVLGLVTKERWFPISDVPDHSGVFEVKSIRERIVPFVAGDYEGSSLDYEHGIAPNKLTEEMRAQIFIVVDTAKQGIINAVSALGIEGRVPDLRGANFMFDSKGKLRFFDTSSMEDCSLAGGVTMTSGLESAFYKITRIEMTYLGKTRNQILQDSFYLSITAKLRARGVDENSIEQKMGFYD